MGLYRDNGKENGSYSINYRLCYDPPPPNFPDLCFEIGPPEAPGVGGGGGVITKPTVVILIKIAIDYSNNRANVSLAH